MEKSFCFLIMLLGFIICTNAQAQMVVIDQTLSEIRIGTNLSFFKDETRSLTIEKIVKNIKGLDKNWDQSDKDVLGFGFTNAVFWVRFTVENRSKKSINWYLNQEYPLIDRMTLYIPNNEGGFRQITTGDHFKFAQRPVRYRRRLCRARVSRRSRFAIGPLSTV